MGEGHSKPAFFKKKGKVHAQPVSGVKAADTAGERRGSKQQRRASKLKTAAGADTFPKITDVYELGKTLGKGHFATVKIGKHKQTGKEFAIKIIEIHKMGKNMGAVHAEIKILQEIGAHPYIVNLVATYEDKRNFYLVMEMCRGGDLFSHIVSDGKYSEGHAIRYCRQLASALQFIHKHGVTHRDLKPENVLLTNNDLEHADIKVADFGLSKLGDLDAIMKTVCGTWAYCAPEVITRKPYGPEVDNWSLGVMMFILLSGYHPFDVYGDAPEPELLQNIADGAFDYNDEVWTDVSPEAKELINSLLTVDPKKRLSLEQFLASEWIMQEGKLNESDEGSMQGRKLDKARTRLSHTMDTSIKFRGLVVAKLAAKQFKASIAHTKEAKEDQAKVEQAELSQLPEEDGDVRL